MRKASFACHYNSNQYNEHLCLYMPSGGISNPTELSQFKNIKERLPNPDYEVWILAKCEWVEVRSVKTINNVAPMGLGFQADTEAANPTDFEFFNCAAKRPACFRVPPSTKGYFPITHSQSLLEKATRTHRLNLYLPNKRTTNKTVRLPMSKFLTPRKPLSLNQVPALEAL